MYGGKARRPVTFSHQHAVKGVTCPAGAPPVVAVAAAVADQVLPLGAMAARLVEMIEGPAARG